MGRYDGAFLELDVRNEDVECQDWQRGMLKEGRIGRNDVYWWRVAVSEGFAKVGCARSHSKYYKNSSIYY
jgi:hypothetical protein